LSTITENEVAAIVIDIASERTNGIATYDMIRSEVPKRYKLSSEDLIWSETRKNEKMWEQKMRNIQSHHSAVGNFIYEGYLEHVPRTGYRVTAKGRALAKRHAA
jgi:hypothetical protein